MKFADVVIISTAAVTELVLLGVLFYITAGYPRLVVRRSLLSFSLRGQFLLMTAFAAWFGWNVHVVKHRRSLAAEIAERGGVVTKVDVDHWDAEHNGGYVPSVSMTRRWLGDEAVGFVDVAGENLFPTAMRESAKAAFPEALVVFGEWQH